MESSTAGRAATMTRPDLPASNGTGGAVPEPSTGSLRRQEGGQPVWRVQCGDLISRERCVTVFVDENEVVLVGPPGESARLTPGQVGQLKVALNEAAKLAEG